MTKVSVIICTHNRCESLLETLKSLQEQIVPENVETEFLVVDNASIDETRTKVSDYISTANRQVRYIFEPAKGKGFALNRGIEVAHGDIIAFTDDDAVADRNWIKNIVKSFAAWDIDCVGGKVKPLWLGKRPEWLTDKLLNVLAVADHGDKPYDVMKNEGGHIFYGVNVAFKKSFFIKNGGYRTDLNSRGGAGNEDLDMHNRLKNARAKAIYNPEVVVHHKVLPERINKSYFRKWHFLTGKDLSKVHHDSERRLLGVPGWMLRYFGSFLKDYVKSILFFDNNSAFFNELKIIMMFSCFKSIISKNLGICSN